jgi:hypothetical protein
MTANEYDDAYGDCSICGAPHRLYPNGNVYQHRKRDPIFGFATGEQCPGATKPPKPGSVDRP